ncbi:MAG: CysS/YqeB C-terminal domain-containing protein [Acidimicrobiales bacterium]
MTRGVLAILGSGETAPGMTKVHRELLAPLTPLRAVNLDTSYGFQLNVPQMSQKLEEYFATSLQSSLTTLHFPSYEKASQVERALFKRQVRGANYVFAGPGSPTYALSQWMPLQLHDDLLSVLDEGGTLCFSSAAALTLGAFTAPVYEIYKVGVEEFNWREGLNVLANFGLNCVVIPHFDNAEGQNYDTRYCYLGEPRLVELESFLPDGVATLGIDEHTAVIFDFDSDTLSVTGRANGYWRMGATSTILANGATTKLEELRTLPVTTRDMKPSSPDDESSGAHNLAELASRGGSAGADALAQLVQLASTSGTGLIDPTALVDGVLRARVTARANAQYALADELRDTLVNAGVEVHDDTDGTTWSLREHP